MKKTNTPPPKNAMQNRRYYLHGKLHQLGYDYAPTERTVFIPFSRIDTPPAAAIELRDKYHYSLQLIID